MKTRILSKNQLKVLQDLANGPTLIIGYYVPDCDELADKLVGEDGFYLPGGTEEHHTEWTDVFVAEFDCYITRCGCEGNGGICIESNKAMEGDFQDLAELYNDLERIGKCFTKLGVNIGKLGLHNVEDYDYVD